MIDNDVISRITQKIRSTRQAKEMTIHELATRAKVSKGLLSKIENTRTLPSLPVFVSILQALEISPKEFFQEMSLVSGKNYFVVRKHETEETEREGRNGFHYYHIFSQNIPMSNLQVSLLIVDPHAKGDTTTTDGYEFKYVISGSCQYVINRELVQLEEGDSIYFDASLPHIPINAGAQPVVMLVVYLFTERN